MRVKFIKYLKNNFGEKSLYVGMVGIILRENFPYTWIRTDMDVGSETRVAAHPRPDQSWVPTPGIEHSKLWSHIRRLLVNLQ